MGEVVRIPRDLYRKIEEIIEGTNWTSVDDYVVDKLKGVLPVEPVYTKEEEELIKERLRRLGYIE